jgi:hypothetical protein
VSEEHNIFIADVGLTNEDCNHIVGVTEQVCKGQYAAYTYAKQTLGCREFPPLAVAVQDAVHSVTHAIMEYSDKRAAAVTAWNGSASRPRLALDEREPHMVKYDVTRRERQKLDMHTDKSEWTFLISLSNGCGMDFTGGGECMTTFETTSIFYFYCNIGLTSSLPPTCRQEPFLNAWMQPSMSSADMP